MAADKVGDGDGRMHAMFLREWLGTLRIILIVIMRCGIVAKPRMGPLNNRIVPVNITLVFFIGKNTEPTFSYPDENVTNVFLPG
jgi:hypothetical protein